MFIAAVINISEREFSGHFGKRTMLSKLYNARFNTQIGNRDTQIRESIRLFFLFCFFCVFLSPCAGEGPQVPLIFHFKPLQISPLFPLNKNY